MEGDLSSGIGKRRVRRRYEDEPAIQEVEKESSSGYVSHDDGGLETTNRQPVRNVSRYEGSPDYKESHGHPSIHDRIGQSRYGGKVLTKEAAEAQKYQRLIRDIRHLEQRVSRTSWESLSRNDQDELGLKRDLLKLYEQRQSESRKSALAAQGSLDANKNDAPRRGKQFENTEQKTRQQVWEERQLGNAVSRQDTDEIVIPESENYDYVFDEKAMIDFTSDNEDLYSETEEVEEEVFPEEQKLLDSLEKEENRILSVKESRKLLPVYQYRDKLMKAVKENQVLIVVGETGSGKTTQLPQYLFEDGYTQGNKFQIAVTQPRRVAATSVATRVSDEMNVVLGKEVGYSIRFDDKTTPNKTIIKYMTDGMLLREFLTDSKLSAYSCIMIDEAHERTLATDILLGLLKGVLDQRKELRILISSATMNAKRFSEFFNNCPIFNIPGRRFPVDIHYTLQPEGNYISAAITTVFQIHTTQALKGDILVFLTGQEEIETTKEKIEQISAKLGSRIPQLIVTPIYANLPNEQQLAIFQKTPDNCRKVVLATNIAETSLTIDGIKYVIDSGYVKENSYVPSTGMTQLVTVACSKASTDQRAGRAGRVGPGKCFRLFTKWSYENELEQMPKAEILRTNLSNTVLLLLSLDVTDLLNFPFMDKPSISALTKSLESLYILGALDSKGKITELGKMMCEFPCEPEFAKVLHTAATHKKCIGVLQECLSIVAMLHETTSIFAGNKKEAVAAITSDIGSDHLLYLEIYNQWRDSNYSRTWCLDHKIQFKTMCRVRNVRDQLFKCCKKLKLTNIHESTSTANDNDVISRITCAFISGFPMNIVQLENAGYKTIGKSKGGISVNLHPSSVVFQNYKVNAQKPDKFILYQQLILTSKEFIRGCLPILQENWLVEMVPHMFGHLSRDKL
ncbi:hypothetical protein KAFR_0F00870 [Kazachstania africana CBS 2517]|uniref:RNA helicase n=1 Tax=Kazachstania africana (strain ATCC 22294 / BCRC 22015 / CBS 2517 / CECT 1963 / NBRC 1671 / NRRL Y-8276) TaxID=1071382 RepID=H2AWD4_KAZAF|nr:hypothetical protein KAFR_0F00870 [Kazachstania africana CBS 2517]CCF58684.1 hypothetical protein KAFR_0F00870 [Kazachstania africana CBS 2517]